MKSPRLRIGIDASSSLPPRTGVGVYTYNLVRHLAEDNSQLDLVLFFNSLRRPLPDEAFLRFPNVSIRRYRIPGPWLLRAWKRFDFPVIERLIGRVDVFHSPSGHLPPQNSGATVATIHDLHFLKDAAQCDSLGGGYLKRTLPQRLPRVDMIMVPTEAVRRDVEREYQIDRERIVVAPNGVDLERFQANLASPGETHWQQMRDRLHLPERYILSLGTLEPRKNFEGLVAAYAHLIEKHPDAPALVIAGADGASAKSVRQKIRDVGLVDKQVYLPGFIPDEDVPLLYRHGRLLVMPSHDEGFGLPLLEAMASGVPVVCSDTPAMREVTGDAALRVPPGEVQVLAGALQSVLSSEGLRSQMIANGLERVKHFSWRECARRTAEVYLRAAERRAREQA